MTPSKTAPRVPIHLSRLLEDSRIEWVFTDGRAHILRSANICVIEADPSAKHAYSGNLYSWEYSKLKPTSNWRLRLTWVRQSRAHVVLQVFSHVIVVDGDALGRAALPSSQTKLRRLADPSRLSTYRGWGDLQPLISNLVAGNFRRFSPESERPATRDFEFRLFPETIHGTSAA